MDTEGLKVLGIVIREGKVFGKLQKIKVCYSCNCKQMTLFEKGKQFIIKCNKCGYDVLLNKFNDNVYTLLK